MNGQEKAEPMMTFTARLDFGSDVGQNYGTLFETETEDGAFVIGAGFMGAYNTRVRSDRYTVQMFIRPTEGNRSVSFQQLPRPSELAGTYIFVQGGRLYARDRADEVIRVWNEEAEAWEVDAENLHSRTRVADGLLVFGDSRATYKDREILGPPEQGTFHGFYYGKGSPSESQGHLCFYHTYRAGESGYREFESDETGFSKLYACPWKHEEGTVDLSQAVVKTLPVVGETPFAWGQLEGEILTCSNIGGLYAFDGDTWRTLVEPVLGTSYQIYTMVNVYDRLLMGQYPTGELFEYDGENVTHLAGQPPRIEGVAGYAREAQTAAIYGGDFWVGVWPWAELWRYNTDTEQWHSEGRTFTHPELTDEAGHPYEKESEAHDLVLNQWGQRITGLVPLGESLYISTSAKWPCEYKAEYGFLDEERLKEYGRVLRMDMPGTLSVPVERSPGSTTLEFAILPDHITISQDGRELGSAPVGDELSAVLEEADIGEVQWGSGVFGKFAGGSLTGRCTKRGENSQP